MRLLDIPPFPREIEIPDLGNFLRSRLSETVVMWPNQAIPLLGAMCHPNDEAARDTLMGILRSWPAHSESGRPPVPDKLGRIHADWLKVADIFHIYCDLIEGRHQERRGDQVSARQLHSSQATLEAGERGPPTSGSFGGLIRTSRIS